MVMRRKYTKEAVKMFSSGKRDNLLSKSNSNTVREEEFHISIRFRYTYVRIFVALDLGNFNFV